MRCASCQAGLSSPVHGSARLLLALPVIGLTSGSALAEEREADPLSLGAVTPRPAAGPVRDQVIEGEPEPLAGASTSDHSGDYQTPDGHTVRVHVSDAYADPEVRAQELVKFLGSLLHAGEMSQLTASLRRPGNWAGGAAAGRSRVTFPTPKRS